ncbi:unnamed protein product [Angiostrongylus costaricensis]|uniref:Uncharacterized protein n=1 Tax=Angiostrongylus costaricensis TaxID=334426 RepID=A0A0R3PC46_ANGCS|nr:unnamed protein product [Angiostrongylus costaricensis]
MTTNRRLWRLDACFCECHWRRRHNRREKHAHCNDLFEDDMMIAKVIMVKMIIKMMVKNNDDNDGEDDDGGDDDDGDDHHYRQVNEVTIYEPTSLLFSKWCRIKLNPKLELWIRISQSPPETTPQLLINRCK